MKGSILQVLRGLAWASLISCAVPLASQSETAQGATANPQTAAAISAPGLRSRMVEGAGGVLLNVIEAGEAGKPALILIHGLGQSHLSWEYQLRSPLAQDYHLIAYDLRGHGNSGTPWLASDYAAPSVWGEDLAQVMAATGARDPVLVGWSYGTWVALDYLMSDPAEPIAGLVLVGGLGGLVPSTATVTEEQTSEAKRIAALNDSGWFGDNFDRGEGINRFFTRREVDDEWSRRTAAVNALLPPYARSFIMQRSFDHSGAAKLLTMPTLIVLGDQDVTTAVPDAAALQAQLPDARLEIFEGSGHLPFAEDFARFNQALAQFARAVQE